MAAVAQTWDRVRTGIRPTVKVVRQAPTIPLIIIVVMLSTAIFAPWLAPHSPYEISLSHKLQPPFWAEGGSTEFLLGTDALGRDMLSRMIFGARMSLTVAIVSLVIAGIIGVTLGLIAGYYGGWIDSLIMRTVDAMFAFPLILLALLLAVVLGPSFQNVIIVLGLVLWARYARLARGETLSWKERDFVAYARVAGTSPFKIMIQHLWPNIMNTIVVMLTLQVGWAIIVEASLSFLGAGIPPPTPAWGGMVAEGRQYIATAWWVSMFPGIAILLISLALNLFGDWLREVLDPKQRQVV